MHSWKIILYPSIVAMLIHTKELEHMKKLLLAILASFSFSAFTQSYIIMDNGITVTIDKAGFAYDVGNYAFPQKITMKGGQFFVEENTILATVDERGTLFRKYEQMPEKIIGRGMNYFISDLGDVFTINSQGGVHIVSDEKFKTANFFGGNYFTVVTDADKKEMDLYTVNSAGTLIKVELTNFKMKDVAAYGGTYFMSNRGVVYTVSQEGAVIPWPSVRVGVLQKRGGNYFIDTTGSIFTIGMDGTLQLPGIPMNLKLATITKLGSNYFLDISGRLFVIDHEGNVF
jgi:hypothetical protein